MDINGEMAKLMGMLGEDPVDLDPDLEDYVVTGDIPMISHPLVHSMYTPQQNSMFNRMYHQKRERLGAAQQSQDWSTYIFLHERPYRVDAFVDIMDYLGNEAYWQLLHDVYIDTENFWQNRETWVMLLSSTRKGRLHMTDDPKDRETLLSLADEVTVYRGVSRYDAIDSTSWTLQEDTARWFAKRFARQESSKLVVAGTAHKHNIIGYTDQRGEAEVIILPEYVADKIVEVIS